MTLRNLLNKFPLIPVLRFIKPKEVLAIAEILINKGFECIEIPMNSPEPLKSIQMLLQQYGHRALIAAGTVSCVDDVNKIADVGGHMIVMPHTDINIITAAKQRNLSCMPGFCTLSEGFAAIAAGADGLKLFPAQYNAPTILKAFRAVLPKDVLVLPTGGIQPEDIEAYYQAGASGFCLGSALYRPGDTPELVSKKAAVFIAAIRQLGQLK